MEKIRRPRSHDFRDHAVTYIVGTDQIYGIDGFYSMYPQSSPEMMKDKEILVRNNDIQKDEENMTLKVEAFRDEIIKNVDKINQLKFDILSKENGSYTSNNGRLRVKSLIQNSARLEDLESEMALLKRNVESAQGLLYDVHQATDEKVEQCLGLHRSRCVCTEPDTIFIRDICDKAADIEIKRHCYSSNVHIERCTDMKNHVKWLRGNNLLSISGCFASPKIYISGLFVNLVVSIKGLAGQPEIHIKGVCISPQILVNGTKLKPTVFVDGVVSDPYLQVGGLGSRLKLNVTGICCRQNAVVGGIKCQTKLRVFGMCNI
ncbi:uncharacterized protein LOC133191476 [Saccostrea echinata]|uniref:uncharacterized protein LOC133191476 n=1 Tax=Saccostrea echinata TaxID=191078 RepID=UPI002A802283|nr:uncharacterized protein LOC133191476 [Saccostrea echinata]